MKNEDLHSSIQRIISDDKPTVRKSIVIGVGGSGMKGVLSAKKWIESNMPSEAHRYMRWVGIDTTDIETSIEGKGARYRFPGDQFFQETRRMLYISSPTPSELSMEFLREKYKNDKCFDWLPNPDVYDISTRAGQGANQTRPIGRIAYFYNEKKIRDALVKERDRLTELSDDPKYFQLMDIKEGQDKKDETITFTIKRGVDKYYFYDKISADHTIIKLVPGKNIRAILSPHTSDDIDLKSFPSDENGPYFELNGSNFDGQKFTFRVLHCKRRGQVSIFITCSIVGGTGNGMFIDLVATVKDIFKDYWPAPRIYGILVLPSAFKRVVYNRNARANAYAALKEIDYYMNGNIFKAHYPSGRYVELQDRLLNDGMIYLLDVENMANNSLQGRDQVQELTGQFIATFVASTVGGAIEERMVNDSTRASVYLPKDESSRRRASYNSFGISRVIYPIPQLKALGFKITALKIIESFLKPINGRLVLETMGNINQGLVRALRLNCRLIFERLYPDYEMDIKLEFGSYKKRLERTIEKNDKRGTVSVLENVLHDYSKEEQEKIKRNLQLRMKKRSELELEKMRSVLTGEIHKYIKDPNRGFSFAGTILEMLLEKLDLYLKKYYNERVSLARHSHEEIEKLISAIDSSSTLDKNSVDAVISMSAFNFTQLVYESMLSSAEEFTREFKALIFSIKNSEVDLLQDKVTSLHNSLKEEIRNDQFDLLEKKNPLFFYLANSNEIKLFLNKYFYSKLSIEDLCNEIDFVSMDREDDKMQFIETYLVSTRGLSVLEKSSSEVKEIINNEYGDILDKSIDEIKLQLYGNDESEEEGLNLNESSLLKIDIEKIKKKIFKIIYSRFEGFNFESISIKQVLDEKNIELRKLLERLDTFSRPYISIDSTGLEGMEYYRTITNFQLDTYEPGDDPAKTNNDLPSRMNHYKKRESAQPNISVETFEVPNLCKPYEIISIGILLGFPIYKINSLLESAEDYHALISEKSHPLHCFNNPALDAKYFPDPFRVKNYINPAKLWTGLLLTKILIEEKGVHVFEPFLSTEMKEIEAREDYKNIILKVDEKLSNYGDFSEIPLEEIAESIKAMGILVKNAQRHSFMFKRDYSLVIRDILDGDGTSDRAKSNNMPKDKYIEKFIKAPEFKDMEELVIFLENEYNVRDFILTSMKDILVNTRKTVSAGADIQLPKWKIDKIQLPVFKDKYAFFDYFEKMSSLEWQNLLKERMVEKLDSLVKSSKFRLESDPTLIDRNKVSEFLKTLDQKVPELVLWEIKVRNKIIR